MKRLLLLLLPLAGCVAFPTGGARTAPARPSAIHQAPVAGHGHDHAGHAAAMPAPRSRTPNLLEVVGSDNQLSRLPLTFEPAATDGEFVGRAAHYAVRLGSTWAEIVPASRGDASAPAASLTMRFEGAASEPRRVATVKAPGRVSYFTGSSDHWRTDLPTFHRVVFSEIYPGIDVAYYGTNREVEYDLLVAPGADPARISIRFDDAASVRVSASGVLEVQSAAGAFALRAPVAYQEHGGIRTPVACRYELRGNSARLIVGDYDRTVPLVIDPVLTYAAMLGGTGFDEAASVDVDAAGNVYLTGTTGSTNFPGAPAPPRGIDVFVAKLDSRGTLVYSAYVGGAGVDEARDMAVDASGHVYVAGTTTSTDFPTRTPRQAANGGGQDAFVFKLSTTGTGMVFATYHGGNGMDEANGVAIDAARNVYVTGSTRSTNFPLDAQRQGVLLGQLDGFVSRFTAAGTALTYSTYHGGTSADTLNGIAVDSAGNASVVGSTTSTNFPLLLHSFGPRGQVDAVVSRFSPAGTLTMSTYWGGVELDVAQAVATTDAGLVFVVGTTTSPDFPVVSPMQAAMGGPMDAFLVVIRPGAAAVTATFYGGSRSERGRGVALNASGQLAIVGQTMSSDLPLQRAAQIATGGNRDSFVAQLNPPYTSLTQSTYVGGLNNDEGTAAAIDALGRIFVAGAATYPFAGAHGASDAFVSGLSTAALGEDTDGDGLSDDWESQYGLDPATAESINDPDGDGVSNQQEMANGTHPHGFYTRYLAEGAASSFFDVRIALFNPTASMARVLLRYQRPADNGPAPPEITQFLSMPGNSRMTVNPELLAGIADIGFATVVESDQSIVVDRTMTWDTRAFGSHAETSGDQPSTTWYLAEGATAQTFNLYYLLQNPGATPAQVEITYLRPAGFSPLTKTYTVAPRSRRTLDVKFEQFPNVPGRPLAETDVSAKITSTVPILVERAMYMTAQGRSFAAGHDAAGVTAPAASWFLAEGATGPFFDMFILVANPNPVPTDVEIRYLLLGGAPITRTYRVAANSRYTVIVDNDPALSDVSTSAVVRSLNAAAPIVVERAMWWPGGNWTEAHNSAGAVVTAPMWALAEGEVGGTRANATYVLIANTSPTAASVQVRVFYEGGGESQSSTYTVPAQSRFNLDMSQAFPQTEGSRFSVLVEGLGATPPELVVERAMYSNVGTQIWAAGTNAPGTPVFPGNTFTVTANGIFPKVLVVDEGSQVRIVNRDPSAPPTDDCAQGGHDMSDDPHPSHGDYPAFLHNLPLQFNQSRMTQNLVDVGSFGVHDHCHGTDTRWKARVVVKPVP